MVAGRTAAAAPTASPCSGLRAQPALWEREYFCVMTFMTVLRAELVLLPHRDQVKPVRFAIETRKGEN